jgi:prepilin-type N-terminal cleavage/methylation domain-containing protein
VKKGFSLIETVVSAALIAILIVAISALNLTNIKTYYINSDKDESFNIARGICEMFKSEEEVIPHKCVVSYINHIDDISDNISDIVQAEHNLVNINFEQISNNNLGKKRYALIIETSVNNQLNVLRVTVISMNEFNNTLNLMVTKPLEAM